MTRCSPVYLVRGDDPYLVDTAVLRLAHEVAGEEAAGIAVEEHAVDQVAGAVDACRTAPFLSEVRVVIVREAGSMDADSQSRVVEYLIEPLDTSVLVLGWGSGRVPAAFDKTVKAAGGTVVDTSVPSGAKGKANWVDERVAESGMKLDAAARELVRRHFGEEVDRVDGLLASLEAAYGPKARVAADEVAPFLGSAGTVPPWDLTDAIDAGDAATALRLLARVMDGGRGALGVMAIVQRHFSAVLAVDGVKSDAEAADVLGYSGSTAAFRAGKVRRAATQLGTERIARAITLLADADLDLKGGTGWPPELVMEVLVARLSRLVPGRRAATGSHRVPGRR